MQKHGGDIYQREYRLDFSVNVNPLGTPERVMEAACEGIRHSDRYPDVECRKLRAKLARAEEVSEEQIVFGNGAADLIFALALANRPKNVLLPAPTFAEYEQAVRMAGGQVTYYELSETEGFLLDERIIGHITLDVDMLFLCNPNNPTGLPLKKALVLRILEQCAACGTLLVVDECFNEFLDAPEEYSVKEYIDRFPGLFILKAFTKVYAMAGLRLGYGFSSDSELLARMGEMRQPWNVSIPAQYAGVAALDETEYVSRCKAMLAGERDYLKAGLTRMGFTVYDSQANYIFFRARPGLYQAMAEQGILIRDCGNYVGLSVGYFRIAVKTHEENTELIHTMEETVGKWKRQ